LDPNWPGLMRSVTDQPAAVFAELRDEPAFEGDFGAPMNALDLRGEPRRPLEGDLLHIMPDAFVDGGFDQSDGTALFFGEVDRGFGTEKLKSPSATVLREGPQDVGGGLVEHDAQLIGSGAVGLKLKRRE